MIKSIWEQNRTSIITGRSKYKKNSDSNRMQLDPQMNEENIVTM